MKATAGQILFRQRVVAGVFLFFIFISLLGAQTSPVSASLARGEKISFILFGIDAADNSRHTDTLMVSVFDPRKLMLSLLSIPRDTRISLPGYLFHRVNEIYGYHMRKKNSKEKSASEVRLGVEYILSNDQQKVSVPYYIQVDYSGFTKMVDILGGVWVDVDQPMHYDDYAGKLHIHFEPGRYLVKGNDALRYVRFRGQTGDRGRIFRQQEFLRSMAKRFANPLVYLKLPEMVSAITSSIHTNMSVWDLLYLAASARRLRPANMGFFILPGQSSGPYWAPKKEAVKNMVSNLFYGAHTEQLIESIAPQANQITINVWNASGKKGVAYQITKFLRKSGFDVVDWGTYAAHQMPTRVIDRKGNILNAQAVGNALGVDSCHSEPNPNALVDVEVIIGQDYQGIEATSD